jgi:Holliday junction resolvase
MPPKPETKRQQQIAAYLRSLGYWVMKVHGGPFQMAGVPDLLAIKNGVARWFEVKVAGAKPTPLQLAVMDELRQAGCPADVVHSIEEVQACLSQ